MIEINPEQFDIYTDYRLVIYSINRKEFDKIEVILANNTYIVKEEYIINNLADFKYKLQVIEDGKWTNKTNYLKFYDDTLLEKIFTDKIQVSDDKYKEILERYWVSNSENYIPEIKTAFAQGMRKMWLSPSSSFNNLKSLIKLSKHTDIAIPLLWENIILYIKELLNFNRELHTLELSEHNYSILINIDNSKKKSLKKYINSRISQLNKIDLEFSKLLTGLFYSYLGDRENASIAIKNAHKYSEKYILKLKIDLGSHTYNNDIGNIEYNPVIKFYNDVQVNNQNLTIIISLDSTFLKYYGIQLFYTIIALKEYHFHFHLVDDEEKVKDSVVDAVEFFKSMIKFMSPSKAIIEPTFSYEARPLFIKDIRTYYACSRFLIAKDIMYKFKSNALIIDADLYIFDNLKSYVSNLEQYDISLPFSKALHSLYPWRRIMAGSVFLKNNEDSLAFLNFVNKYIVNNLAKENTWTLDQNALSYAYEKIFSNHHHINIGDSTSYYTPFYQPPIRTLIEKK